MTWSGSLAAVGVAAVCGVGVGGLGACTDLTPDLPPTLQSLAFDTVFEVGAASGEPWEVFDGIWDIAVDADGRMAVLGPRRSCGVR